MSGWTTNASRRTRRWVAGIAALGVAAGTTIAVSPGRAVAFDAPLLVSADAVGTPGDAPSGGSRLDVDKAGDLVVFSSSAANLVPGDDDGLSDVYLRDVLAGVTVRVSTDATGSSLGGHAYNPVIAGDGSAVAFELKAPGAPGPFGGHPSDVLLRAGGDPVSLLPTADGLPPNGESIPWAMTDDGRWVLVTSAADNLDVAWPGGTDAIADAYVVDRDADGNGLLDDSAPGVLPLTGTPGGGGADGAVRSADMSADGRYVVVMSEATNLVDGFVPTCSTTPCSQIYGIDRDADGNGVLDDGPSAIELLSGTVVDPLTDQAFDPSVANDGTVAFATYAAELSASPSAPAIVVRHPDGVTDVVGSGIGPVLTDDGGLVGFLDNDRGGAAVVTDLARATTELVSVDGAGASAPVLATTISGDGTLGVYAGDVAGLPGAGTLQVYARGLGSPGTGVDCAAELGELVAAFDAYVSVNGTPPVGLDELYSIGSIGFDPAPRWTYQSGPPAQIVGTGDCAGSSSTVTVPAPTGPGDTPVGTIVDAGLAPWDVVFAEVTGAGVTTVVPNTAAVPVPTGATLVGDAVDISTTAVTIGWVRVCVVHDGSLDEPALRLLRLEGGAWRDVTSENRHDIDRLCARTDGLGTYALVVGDAPDPVAVGTTAQVSVSSQEDAGNARSSDIIGDAGVSADGRYVTFSSTATNLAGGGNGTRAVYRRDVWAGETRRVSADTDGTSFAPAITADGRYVTYTSVSGSGDVVRVRDVATSTTVTIGAGRESDISADGRWLVYHREGTVYVHDRDADADGSFDEAGATSTSPLVAGAYAEMSPNGRFVVFVHDFTTYLADRDGDGDGDYDEGPAAVVAVNATASGEPGNDSSGRGDVADNGDVAFWTYATNVGAAAGQADAFVRDFETGEQTPVGRAIGNTQHISADGRYVAFDSSQSNGVASDTNGFGTDVFVHDRRTGVTRLVSVADDGGQPASSYVQSMSADGATVAWATFASAASTDTNAVTDLYVRRLGVTDTDGDGIPDSLECDPDASGAVCDLDGGGHTVEIVTNGTGEQVTFVDLPAPDGMKIIVGGTSGQVSIRGCGSYTLAVPAGSELDVSCGSIDVTVFDGPVEVTVDGERELTVWIPTGVRVAISTPVDGAFTVEILSGTSVVRVSDPDDPFGRDETYVYPGSGAVTISNSAPARIDSVTFSSNNVAPSEPVDVTVEFSDDPAATHTCEITWEPGVTVAGTVTGTTCTASHTYATAGVRSVQVRIVDGGGGIGFGGGAVLVLAGDPYWTYDAGTTFHVTGSSGLEGIAVDPVTQEIWVVNGFDNAIEKFDATGGFLFSIGGFGTTLGRFNLPSSVAVAANGDLYATDIGGNRVQQFDREGNFVRAFGSTSSGGSLALSNPRGIAIDAAGTVYVADIGNGRVQKYTATGTYLGTLPNTGTAPFNVAIDPDGYVWVSDFTGSRTQVHKIDPTSGARITTIGGLGQPTSFAFDDVGQIHIVNFNTKEIVTHTVSGAFVERRPMPVVATAWGSSGQPQPSRAAITGDGRLLVTTGYGTVVSFLPPVPADTDGDGIPDTIECTPDVAGAFCDPDGGGHTGTILTNGTGEPVTFVDLPDPAGVKVIVGGASGQVSIRVCGAFTLTAPAGSEVDLTCGSVTISAVEGSITITPDGDRVVTITVPAGTTARITSPVNDDFTVEILDGDGPVVVDTGEPDDPWDPDGGLRYVYPASGAVPFTSNVAPTVESVTLSAVNVAPGEQIDVTATFSDPGVDDTHTCEITWTSGVTLAGTVTAGACTGSYTYAGTGLANVIVRVVDDAGDAGTGGGTVLVVADTYWTLVDGFPVAGNGAGAIDVDPVTQDIWVATGSSISKYSPDGTLLLEVGAFGTGPGQFNGVGALVVGNGGDVYATDVGGNRVQQFTRDGQFVRSFASASIGGSLALDNPLGIDVDASGNVLVADVFNGRVQKYSPTGAYLGTIGGTGSAPYAVGVDPDGFVWVSDYESAGRDKVHKIDPATGARLVTIYGLGQAVDLEFDDLGQVHIVNFNTKEVITYTLAGAFVARRPMPVIVSPFGSAFQPYPSRVAMTGAGQLLLTGGGAVSVFAPPVPPDADGDGIPDDLECVPDVIDQFCDTDGGGHVGRIVSNGTGEPVSFVDLPAPDGVKVVVGGTSGQVSIRLCGFVTLSVPAGGAINVTCGSITVEVVAGGPISIVPDGDVTATITVPNGVRLRVVDDATEDFTIEYLSGASPATVVIDGETLDVDQDSGPIAITTNVAPTIVDLTTPVAPVRITDPVVVEVSFDDPGIDDVHTCVVDWGDGSTTDEAAAGRQCSASHLYQEAGVYTVTVTVNDDAGDADAGSAMVVVYDPDGGFVTGGGWIDSPVGAFAGAPDIVGKATFGFVSKYRKGSTVPDGNTEFQFHAAGMRFRSTSYEWLVVSGSYARFKGTGTIDGAGSYTFMIWAGDGTADTFRIKITSDADGAVVYDNGMDQAIGGGQVVVHTPKR